MRPLYTTGCMIISVHDIAMKLLSPLGGWTGSTVGEKNAKTCSSRFLHIFCVLAVVANKDCLWFRRGQNQQLAPICQLLCGFRHLGFRCCSLAVSPSS